MKKLLLFGLMALSSKVFAQTLVAFGVQIPTGTIVDSVDATGNWVDTCGLGANWNKGLKLTLVGGTYVGSVTMPIGTYQYKFRTYSAGTQSWESVPSACGVGNTLNREIVVGTSAAFAGPFCIGTCNASCPSAVVNVNLKTIVDMNGVNRIIPAGCTKVDMVNVTGSFGADAGFPDWTPGSIPMTETSTGSKIYEKTLAVKSKSYIYKFLRADGWDFTDANNVKTQFSEQKDSFAVKTCLDGDNRSIDLTGAAAGSTTVAYYKWQSCTVGTPLSIGSNWVETIFSAQPNPFNGNTTIQFTNNNKEIFSLSVVNAMGQVVFSKSNITASKQEVGNLPIGIYTVVLRNAQGKTLSLRLSAQ